MIMLSILWVCWCTMHSLLINTTVVDFLKRVFPGLIRNYRFCYNIIACITIIPVVVVTRLQAGEIVFGWYGYSNFLRITMLAIALYLFRGGAKIYDFETFLGIKQYRTGEEQLLLTDSGEIVEEGVFAVTRHPWYLGSLLLIWSVLPSYPEGVFLAAAILSIYLIIGTLLEEQKILARYGERYRQYSAQVSMLFPWKWILRTLSRNRENLS